MAERNVQVLFRRELRGLLVVEDFEIVETAVPVPAAGELLVRGRYLSLDPYMRMLMGGGWTFLGSGMTPGQVMVGRVLGEVVESRDPNFAPGELVVGRLGWQTHALATATALDFKVVPRKGVPPTAYLGACGSNGTTAWAGLKMIGAPKPGETVLVSAAAGSVGSAVGQIAKVLGCRALGIAGGAEKCRIVTQEFGFDACCDYKSGDLAGRLRAAAPDGIDVYFDNVGGAILDACLKLMNFKGRIPTCGLISQYNATEPVPGPYNYPMILMQRLRVEGFIVLDFAERYPEAIAALGQWMAEGKIKVRTEIVDGLENALRTVKKLYTGANMGKLLIRVKDM